MYSPADVHLKTGVTMKSDCIQAIFDIVLRRLRWVAPGILFQTLDSKKFSRSTIESSIRFLRKTKMIERHAFNCPSMGKNEAIWKSGLGGSPSAELIVAEINDRNSVASNPSELITASRLTTGLFGIGKSQIRDGLDWQAHHRLGNAFTIHVSGDCQKIEKWKCLSDGWLSKSAKWADFDELIVCTPLTANLKAIRELLDQLRYGGASYEIW